jgi:cytochrome c5
VNIRNYSIFAALVGSALLAGCANQTTGEKSSGASATTQPSNASATVSAAPSGAQLWADNCSRCHNIRPPQSYNDAQWEAVGMHMRLRANLTGTEQREITRFLQASH